MFTDALWSTMLSIVLLLLLTLFFKAVFFRYIYDAGLLTTPQVLVDWRLWSLDTWFWIVLGALIVMSLLLNYWSTVLEKTCKKMDYNQRTRHNARINALSRNDAPELLV